MSRLNFKDNSPCLDARFLLQVILYASMKVNRNDPCPCGSGIKFKKCCMDKKNIDPLQDLKEDIHNLIGGWQFGSMEELQAVLT